MTKKLSKEEILEGAEEIQGIINVYAGVLRDGGQVKRNRNLRRYGVRIIVRSEGSTSGIAIIFNSWRMATALSIFVNSLEDERTRVIYSVDGKRSWRNLLGHPYYQLIIT